MSRQLVAAALITLGGLSAGCARGNAEADARIGGLRTDYRSDDEPSAEPFHDEEPAPNEAALAGAEQPFFGYDVAAKSAMLPESFFSALAEADVLCLGERHDNARDHYAQARILLELFDRGKVSGRRIALGLEMVEQTNQPVLDRFTRREMPLRRMLREVRWHKRWGFDAGYYTPMLRMTRDRGGRLIGLNIPRALTMRVARSGLDGLSDAERAELPALDLGNSEHRAYFEAATKDHPAPASSADSFYMAQVLWDEAMASRAAKWVVRKQPANQMVILAGNGHCHETAIPARVRRRIPANVVSVRPVVEDEDGKVTEKPEHGHFDYYFVMGRDY